MTEINYGAKNVDELVSKLNRYVLDPDFEKYGNFIIKNPKFPKSRENTEKYKGWTYFFGNFFDYSNAFSIFTNDKNVVKLLTKVIRNNQKTNEYQKARKERIESEEKLERIRMERINELMKK